MAGEDCDDGEESEACDDDCSEAECGDGTLNRSAGEQCDDGNDDNFDGCDASCVIDSDHPFYSEDFPAGVVSSSGQQCTNWNGFRTRLTGNYAAIELSGSNVQSGVRCEDAQIATRLCNALNQGGSISEQCGNDTWMVGECGGTAISVNAPVCQCDQANSGAHVVRPCINNENWGGMNSTTCSAVAQRLEVRCLTDSTSVYEHEFPQAAVPTNSEQCVDYTEYTANLTGRYFSATLSGSNDTTGVTCNDPAIATQLCNALATSTELDVDCNGIDWRVGDCSTGTGFPFEISAGTGSACSCSDEGYTLRPCIGNNNWGGINGNSCSAPTQTMRLECNAQPSYYSAQFPAGTVSSGAAQCTAWEAFRAELVQSSYTRVTVRGSANPGGLSCSDPGVATQICSALNTSGTVSGLSCDGNTWSVGECGGTAVAVNSSVCECTTGDGHIVRPCIDNANWGGMGTATCSGEAQSMDVICE
jgi:cysteine-rich repeat protein